jgi:hypothetical protein
MPSKKSTPAKKAARGTRPRGKKKTGLTSALGPRATTALIICVLAGGIALAARQQTRSPAAPAIDSAQQISAELQPEGVPTPTKRATPAAVPSAAPSEPSSGAASAARPKPTTISGCLDRRGEEFRLKDTAGDQAPKARSWKSGFIKKGSATVAVVDGSHALNLADHVGQRVVVSGALVDREMTAQSLRTLAPACKTN